MPYMIWLTYNLIFNIIICIYYGDGYSKTVQDVLQQTLAYGEAMAIVENPVMPVAGSETMKSFRKIMKSLMPAKWSLVKCEAMRKSMSFISTLGQLKFEGDFARPVH